jgi:hypothetical protein
VIEGSITYGGKTWKGGKTKEEGTYMFVQAGAELGEMTSPQGGTFFIIELPMLADIAAKIARGETARPRSPAKEPQPAA